MARFHVDETGDIIGESGTVLAGELDRDRSLVDMQAFIEGVDRATAAE